MTILWFIIWLIANSVGGREPLVFNPVNAWAATLILAIGLDLAAAQDGFILGRRVAFRASHRAAN
jgi:hypothetical protein